jgi:hypothetical protein
VEALGPKPALAITVSKQRGGQPAPVREKGMRCVSRIVTVLAPSGRLPHPQPPTHTHTHWPTYRHCYRHFKGPIISGFWVPLGFFGDFF